MLTGELYGPWLSTAPDERSTLYAFALVHVTVIVAPVHELPTTGGLITTIGGCTGAAGRVIDQVRVDDAPFASIQFIFQLCDVWKSLTNACFAVFDSDE